MKPFPPVIFVSGIDTDAGKSYVSAWLADVIESSGKSAVTQKFIQTGCTGISEDIETHSKLRGKQYPQGEMAHLVAPVILSYPASPDLAARIDGTSIDFSLIAESTERLSRMFDHVILEGAGGVMVPLKDDYITLDYITDHRLPVILVTNGRLGSVNHTLLSLSVIKQSGAELFGVVYNPHFDADKIIAGDTRKYIKTWLNNNFPDALWLEMPENAFENNI